MNIARRVRRTFAMACAIVVIPSAAALAYESHPPPIGSLFTLTQSSGPIGTLAAHPPKAEKNIVVSHRRYRRRRRGAAFAAGMLFGGALAAGVAASSSSRPYYHRPRYRYRHRSRCARWNRRCDWGNRRACRKFYRRCY